MNRYGGKVARSVAVLVCIVAAADAAGAGRDLAAKVGRPESPVRSREREGMRGKRESVRVGACVSRWARAQPVG